MGKARRRWAMFVSQHSRGRVWPYFCLLLTIALSVLQFTRYSRVHFLLVMLVVTLLAFERLAFAELLADRDMEIARLRAERGGSSKS